MSKQVGIGLLLYSLAVLVTACTLPPAKLYDGNTRPAAELAIVKRASLEIILSVDGQPVMEKQNLATGQWPRFQYEAWVEPGRHKIEYSTVHASWEFRLPTFTANLELEPGHVYVVRDEHHDCLGAWGLILCDEPGQFLAVWIEDQTTGEIVHGNPRRLYRYDPPGIWIEDGKKGYW